MIILRDVFFEEIYTDSFLVISCKNALAVALNHARFSDGSIANDYHLQRKEKTIKVGRYICKKSTVQYALNFTKSAKYFVKFNFTSFFQVYIIRY